jgi:hypothetical protein
MLEHVAAMALFTLFTSGNAVVSLAESCLCGGGGGVRRADAGRSRIKRSHGLFCCKCWQQRDAFIEAAGGLKDTNEARTL